MTRIPSDYAPPRDLLKDRIVLITGAGDGLGRATARLCGRLGATVILLGRTAKKLEAAYDEIVKDGAPEPAIYPFELAGAAWKDYEQLAATLEREFGVLHGLVHCAAHFKAFLPMVTVEAKDWFESLQVNLTAPFALTRNCLPLLDQSGDGSIVFVSDASGRRGKAYAGPYGVAKFGIEGLMQTWAQELERDGRVRVNTLDPGPMNTALRRRGYTDTAPIPEADSVAPAIAWLLGRDSAGVRGEALSLSR